MKHSQKRIFMDIEKMTSDEFKAFCRSGNKNYFTRIRKMPLQDLLFTMINRKGLTLALELRNYMKLAHPGVSISKKKNMLFQQIYEDISKNLVPIRPDRHYTRTKGQLAGKYSNTHKRAY